MPIKATLLHNARARAPALAFAVPTPSAHLASLLLRHHLPHPVHPSTPPPTCTLLTRNSGVMHFIPPLPSEFVDAISRLGYGEALKVGLRFPRVFWPADAHFVGKIDGDCSRMGSARHVEFVNVALYTGVPALLMETETETARALAALTDKELLAAVLAQLRKMFPHAPLPVASVVARLSDNPFQRGGFTFMPTGGTKELHGALAQPLSNGRLLLAGEHTSALHPGTVHGAIVSGRRAAAQALAAMRGEDPAAGGVRFEDEYTETLFRRIYDETQEDEGEWEWDRNP